MEAIACLSASLDRLESVCAELSREQAGFRLNEGTWSVDECIEHLAMTESFANYSIRKALQGNRATAEEASQAASKNTMLDDRIRLRVLKVQAPPQAQPTGRYGAWPLSLVELRANRQKLMDLAAQADESWDLMLSPHPLLGNLSARQWLRFAARHLERHTAQVEELIASVGFPRA